MSIDTVEKYFYVNKKKGFQSGNLFLSGRRESNPRHQLGRLR